MRKAISGVLAAMAVLTASAAPALACGGGIYQGACSPCGQAYVSPCAPPPPVYSACDGGCWPHERLPDPAVQDYADPVHQYYYVNQGPTYTGPGDFAPYPTYREGAVSGWDAYRHRWHAGRYYGSRERVLRRYY
jgi:hypothetical protein